MGHELCRDVREVRAEAEKSDTSWINLTYDQWEFLRGIYAMNPLTPAGLPFGDKAVLVQQNGQNNGGLIIFLDDSDMILFNEGLGPRPIGLTGKACTPMVVPNELIKMLLDLDTIPHEGKL
jgi:hypothetical protein